MNAAKTIRAWSKTAATKPIEAMGKEIESSHGLEARGPWRLSEILILLPRYTRSDESSSPRVDPKLVALVSAHCVSRNCSFPGSWRSKIGPAVGISASPQEIAVDYFPVWQVDAWELKLSIKHLGHD